MTNVSQFRKQETTTTTLCSQVFLTEIAKS